jgi:hypothetical protein
VHRRLENLNKSTYGTHIEVHVKEINKVQCFAVKYNFKHALKIKSIRKKKVYIGPIRDYKIFFDILQFCKNIQAFFFYYIFILSFTKGVFWHFFFLKKKKTSF